MFKMIVNVVRMAVLAGGLYAVYRKMRAQRAKERTADEQAAH